MMDHPYKAQKRHAINLTHRFTWWAYYNCSHDEQLYWINQRANEAGRVHESCHDARRDILFGGWPR